MRALAVASCYSPTIHDCALACASDDDCAAGQSCSAGLCATTGVACGDPQTTLDGSTGGPPPPSPDAVPPHDAATLHDADARDDQHRHAGHGLDHARRDDMYVGVHGASPGRSRDQRGPIGKAADVFDAWTSALCHDQAATCSFTPTASAPLDAVCVKKNGQDGQ